jgi:chromosome segregation protein
MFLLGGTLVCETLASATAIAKKYRSAFKIVTIDGDIIAQSGAMTGGSRRQNETNLLSVDRSLNEYAQAVEKGKADLERLTKSKQNLLDQVNLEVTELDSLKTALTEAKQKFVALQNTI